MSERLLRNIKELSQSIENNMDSARRNLATSGSPEADSAIVTSAAKYHHALQMLADE